MERWWPVSRRGRLRLPVEATGRAVGNALPTVLPAVPNARFTIAPAPVSAETLKSLQMSGNAGYIILASPAQTEADAFRGIDALHRYYDAHKEELIAQWQQMEAERIAREQYEKEHPPVPKDTLIQFWPKKNSRYLKAAATATSAAATSATATTGVAAIDSSHGVPGLLSGEAAAANETTGGKERK